MQKPTDIKLELAVQIAEYVGLTSDEIYNMIETPADAELGDFALPCFKLSKVLKNSPANIAKDLCQKLEGLEGAVGAGSARPLKGIEKLQNINGYTQDAFK